MGKQVQVIGTVISNERLQGDYYRMVLQAPDVAALARPGKFVHLQVPGLGQCVLRRPFSISDYDVQAGSLTLVYKVVGKGSARMHELAAGTGIDLLGALGKGYRPLPADRRAVLVGGGYGCAAIYCLARLAKRPPLILLGGRSAGDILLEDEFRRIGCEVRVATNDGSYGTAGFVTVLLHEILAGGEKPWVATCGPLPMLKAVALMSEQHGCECEVSLDSAMCCGVGACFSCVVKCRAATPEGWHYVRVCSQGPVFKGSEVYWEGLC